MTTIPNTVSKIIDIAESELEKSALALGISVGALRSEFLAEMRERTLADGRAVDWHTRVRLWEYPNTDKDPVADTDPDRGAGEPGEEISRGLPSVASFALEVASGFHKAPSAGLNAATLKRKVASLRSQMSNGRRDSGFFNVHYEVVETKFGTQMPRDMLMRVDVARVGTTPYRPSFKKIEK